MRWFYPFLVHYTITKGEVGFGFCMAGEQAGGLPNGSRGASDAIASGSLPQNWLHGYAQLVSFS